MTDNIEDTVKDAVTKIKDYKKTGKIVALVVAALASLFTILGLYLKLRKQGRELAKLKHDKNVHDEEVRRAAADALIKQDLADKDAALDKAEHHLLVSQGIAVEIDKIILDNQKQKDTIQALADWEQIDEYLKNR